MIVSEFVKKNTFAWYAVVAGVTFMLDRVTKSWILTQYPERVAFNRGVAWSLFYSHNDTFFWLVSSLVILVMIGVAWHGFQRIRIGSSAWGEVLVVAGALSNIFDRFAYGGVIDFIALEYDSWCWPLFNVADIAVVIGVLLMFREALRS